MASKRLSSSLPAFLRRSLQETVATSSARVPATPCGSASGLPSLYSALGSRGGGIASTSGRDASTMSAWAWQSARTATWPGQGAAGAACMRPLSTGAAEAARSGPKRMSTTEMGMYVAAASVAMIGFAYASVPIYRAVCAATGYGGTVRAGKTVEEKLKKRQENPDLKTEEAAAQRTITVWFNADVADNMPWRFQPTQECVRVKPGQSTLAFFTACNNSDKAVTGYSLYNVTPEKAAQYFNKIQCFCFEEQRLRANEEVDMPVFFYIDPEMATDWNCRNINDITLSYVFNKVDDEDLEEEEDDGAPTQVKLHGPGMAGQPPMGMGPISRAGGAAPAAA